MTHPEIAPFSEILPIQPKTIVAGDLEITAGPGAGSGPGGPAGLGNGP